jgi:hypothetical protein
MDLGNTIKQTIVGGVIAVASLGVMGHQLLPSATTGSAGPVLPGGQQPPALVPNFPSGGGVQVPANGGGQVATPQFPTSTPIAATQPPGAVNPADIAALLPKPPAAPVTVTTVAPAPVVVATPPHAPVTGNYPPPLGSLTPPTNTPHPTLPPNGIGTVYIPPPPPPK